MTENGVNFNRLLIIDDDQGLGVTLKGILKKVGYDVEWVTTGSAGVEYVQKQDENHPLSAVFIDIRLPDMNGLDVLRAIKKKDPDIGAIMMTGFTNTETAISAMNEGAFAYLQKPYNVMEVKAMIERLIEKQKLIWENRILLQKMVELNADLEKRVTQRTMDLENANTKLAHTISKLREADQARSEFISMVSHELRTPLTAIIGFAQTIINQLEKLEKDNLKHFLQIIYTNGMMLSRLVESLLDMSRIQRDGMNLHYERFDLKSLTESVVESLRIIKPGLNFEVDIASEVREINCDKDRVQQVLTNLIGNAIKYSYAEGSVKVSGRLKGGEVEIRVADSGPGIPENALGKIFDAFFRVKDPINMKTPGTGLGLTITKALVEALGGTIGVESKVGYGSTFTFIIPRERKTAETEATI